MTRTIRQSYSLESPISELYVVALEAFKELSPFKGKGIITGRFAEKIQVAFTADNPATFIADQWGDQKLEPYKVYIWKNGWLAGVIGPSGGVIMQNNNLDEEARLIGAIKLGRLQ